MTTETSPLARLLSAEPTIVTAGVELFETSLRDQGVAPVPVDWRPPAGAAADLARIAADPRTADANATALERITAAEPHWVGITTARDAVGIETGQFLHAGPPITWERASGPLRGALIGAMLYEGMADTPEQAIAIAERGELELAPCHSRAAVGPMAGVVSPSMPMFAVENGAFGNRAYCTLNEGLGKVLRYGAYGPEVIERLQWMQQVLAPAMDAAVGRLGSLDLRALIVQALQMGDELHNRNRAASALFVREVVPPLLEAGIDPSELADVVRFINGNEHFFLNLGMPAGKAAVDPARDLPGCTVVVAMARNGTDFGIQVSGTGDRWFTGPAQVPDGLFLGDYGPEDANPDIGDSTITETSGVGGFAMAAAPAIVRFVGGEVGDALTATRTMYDLALGEHPHYQIPILEFRGTPVGIDATRVVRTGIVPAVNTGIAGREAGVGQVGAGLVEPPMEAFVQAVAALAAS
ncbi:DUF1116 domain-containing protein [Egicoccus halophilus]|uniref:DUF1116 domain-containing protein n=1 Tax=Egicoccus halophilus TaxID=1670830 RepID=A0A8J3A823_9ACTN|nr:DUF1116 domain-containing protein [Egicoccus halophilus]GGI04246.1 hypothetical protein GCM10011354_08150 [Egicoccus halophilus]